MENQNVYEVTELQEYNKNQQYQFQDDSNNSKHVEELSAKLKVVSLVNVTGLVVVIVLLIAILGVQIAHLSTSSCSVCDTTTQSAGVGNTNGATSSSAGPVGSNVTGPNCSIVHNNEWSDAVQSQMFRLETQVGKLINASEDVAWKINDIRNTVDSQTELTSNNMKDIDKILNTTGNSAQKLMNIVNTLSNIQDTSTSTAGVADDILLIAQELLELHNETAALPTSCHQIKQQQPNSPSGAYVLATIDGTTSYNVHCNMEEFCGSEGGWTRLAYLDMTDSTVNCPSGFQLFQSGGVRACGRPTSSGGSCIPIQFPSNGISYSQVCGRVTGYQWGLTDAVHPRINNGQAEPNHNDINSYYVDGVSITHGSPRQHVWTFMAGQLEASYLPSYEDGTFNCPCSAVSTQNSTLQSFIGDDYFCESGNPSTDGTILYTMLTSDPLWDGEGCGILEGNCCTAHPSLPWFNKVLSGITNNYLELRLCGDRATSIENSPISFYELYVK